MNIRERHPCRQQINKLMIAKNCGLSELLNYNLIGKGARKQLELMLYEQSREITT